MGFLYYIQCLRLLNTFDTLLKMQFIELYNIILKTWKGLLRTHSRVVAPGFGTTTLDNRIITYCKWHVY